MRAPRSAQRLWRALWVEERIAGAALLLSWALLAVSGSAFSLQRVAGGYAVFLARIAAIVAVVTVVDRVVLRLRGRRPDPVSPDDVLRFARSTVFYLLALTAYTNLKTHTLELHPRLYDSWLRIADRVLLLGGDTVELAPDRLHPLLTGFFDWAYLYAWIPLAITFGLVFSRQGGDGFRRLARVVSLNYLVGATLYVLLPAWGPALVERDAYSALAASRSYRVQELLLRVQQHVAADPAGFHVPAFMGLAAFPSLHFSHIYLPVLVAWRRARALFAPFLLFLLAVSAATVYFGWHWVIDLPAGLLTIHLCLAIGRRLDRFAPAAAESPRRLDWESPELGRALGRWPVFGLWVLLQVGVLTAVWLAVVAPSTGLPAGPKVTLLLFIPFLALTEAGVLVLLNAAFERLTARFPATWALDLGRALLLAAGTVVWLASYLKLRLTGTHLSLTDLEFAAIASGQIAQEAAGAERTLLAILAAAGLALTLALFFGFRRLRRRPVPLPAGRALILLALAALGLAYTWRASPATTLFARSFVAEIAWAAGSDAPAAPSLDQPPPRPGPPIEPWAPEPPESRPNVVLVMLESIPWKRTAWAGGPAEAMPNLLELDAESVVFSRPYAASTHSDYAQMAILSSLDPRKYEDHDFYRDIPYPRTLLWDALRPLGWSTGMFSCQNERWGNMLSFLETPGIEHLRHSLDWPEAPHKGDGLESKVYEETPVRAWREWLDAAEREPFLAYFNFQAGHFPYEVPDDAERPFAPWALDFPASFLGYPRERIPDMLNRFYNALRYSDRWLGEIVEELRRRGIYERTVLVVVSDHGEAFYEHGVPTHGTTLHEEQVRSVLVMRLPGEPPRVVDEPVSLLDVAPALLDHLGLPPHGNFQGRSDILDPGYSAAGRPLFFTIQGMTASDGVLLDGSKYMVDWARRVRALYDLQTDPDEQRNLIRADPIRAAELAEVLDEHLARQLHYYETRGWEQRRYPPRLP